MFYICVTRFNIETWRVNNNWKVSNNYSGCIYNTPVYIKNIIPLEMPVYIIEMNNDTNEIMGIGKIYNKVYTDKKYNIYNDKNYNRYTYRGNQYLSREKIINEKNEIKLVHAIEKSIFKGKGHLKRGHGISMVSILVYMKFSRYINDLFYTGSLLDPAS